MLGKNKVEIYRQGDILLRRIGRIPDGCKRKDNVIAYGEKTGHKHQFNDLEHVQTFQKEGIQYIHVDVDETILSHDEHEALRIPQGDWMVVPQREFDAIHEVNKEEERIRRVMD